MAVTTTCDCCGKLVNGGVHLTYAPRQYADGEAVPLIYMVPQPSRDFCGLPCLSAWLKTEQAKYGWKDFARITDAPAQ